MQALLAWTRQSCKWRRQAKAVVEVEVEEVVVVVVGVGGGGAAAATAAAAAMTAFLLTVFSPVNFAKAVALPKPCLKQL